MQLQPSHHADDIGARLGLPSRLRVEISATGVPKYRIVGSIVLCMQPPYDGIAAEIYPVLVFKFLREADRDVLKPIPSDCRASAT
jgi:hypothetical protein